LSGMNSVEGCCWRYSEGEQDDVTLQPNQHGQTAGTSTLTRFLGHHEKICTRMQDQASSCHL
jgi:hypothetical protein